MGTKTSIIIAIAVLLMAVGVAVAACVIEPICPQHPGSRGEYIGTKHEIDGSTWCVYRCIYGHPFVVRAQ